MPRSSSAIRMVPIILGLLGTAAWIILGAYNGSFMPWHFALAGLSAACAIGGLIWLHDARWRDSLATLVYSVFFVLCVAMVYLISANRQVRWDITRDRVHSLNPQTIGLLGRIPPQDSLLIEIFAPAIEHDSYRDFLEAYRKRAPQLAYQLYDPDRDLDMALRFPSAKAGFLNVTLTKDDGNTRTAVGQIDKAGLDREDEISNAIARTLSTDERAVYFTIGHGEVPLDGTDESLTEIGKLVASQGIPVRGLRLLQGPIPDDAAVIVMASPKTDLFDSELEMIEKYLDGGGKLLLMIDPLPPSIGKLTNVEKLIGALGFESPNAVIVDPDMFNNSNSSFWPMIRTSDHPIGKSSNNVPFVLPLCRPIEPLENPPAGLRLEALAGSGEHTWTEPLDDLRSSRRPVPPELPADLGVQLAAAVASRDVPGGRFGNVMRAIIIGDSDGFTNANLKSNAGAAGFATAAVVWLREPREQMYIPQKILTTTPVTLTPRVFYMLLGGFLLLGLLVTIGGASFTIARRRSR